ncbi:hypothetical protein AB0N28_31715, partial [Streptomyces sp. NPDC051130]
PASSSGTRTSTPRSGRPWPGRPEGCPVVPGGRAWLVAGSGAAVAALLAYAAATDPQGLRPGVVPLVAPALPLWPAAAILIGLLPALVAPVPPKEASSL